MPVPRGRLTSVDAFLDAFHAAGPDPATDARFYFAVDARDDFDRFGGILVDRIGGLQAERVGDGMVREGGALRSADRASSTLRFPDIGSVGADGWGLVWIGSCDDDSPGAQAYTATEVGFGLVFDGTAAQPADADQTSARIVAYNGTTAFRFGGNGYFDRDAARGLEGMPELLTDRARSPMRTVINAIEPGDRSTRFLRCGARRAVGGPLPGSYVGTGSIALTLSTRSIRTGFIGAFRGRLTAKQAGLCDLFGVHRYGQAPSVAAGNVWVIAPGNSIFEGLWVFDDPSDGAGRIDEDGPVGRALRTANGRTRYRWFGQNMGKSGYAWKHYYTDVEPPPYTVTSLHHTSQWAVRGRYDAEAARNVILCHEDINSAKLPASWSLEKKVEWLVTDSNEVLQRYRDDFRGTDALIAVMTLGPRTTLPGLAEALAAARDAALAAHVAPFDVHIRDWVDRADLQSDDAYAQDGVNVHLNRTGSRRLGDAIGAALARAVESRIGIR